MVTTRFIGRLGNSMYQVAACIAYARKFGYEWAVPYDARESSIHRVYPNLPKTHSQPQNWPRDGYDPKWYDYFDFKNVGSDVLLAGFWQSYKWFAHCEDEVKKVFELPHVPGYEDYVSVHIRRGDFVQYAGSFPPITAQYISYAQAKITEIKKTRNESLDWGCLVFSDDIQWVKDNLKDKIFIHSKDVLFESTDELQSLSTMASCGHHIICNSSFSWWAAYLGHNPGRIIVSPHHSQWYGKENGVVLEARRKRIEPCLDLIPDKWIQIKL